MKEESGRSLIEIVGILAIGVIMIAATYNMYKTIDQRQKRMIAYEDVKEVARKTKILYEYSGYQNVSIANLHSKGAVSSEKAPIGSWTLESVAGGEKFKITLSNLSYGECKYFATKKSDDWSIATENTFNCNKSSSNNTVSFFVK